MCAPSSSLKDFCTELINQINSFAEGEIFLAGDSNAVTNPFLDVSDLNSGEISSEAKLLKCFLKLLEIQT